MVAHPPKHVWEIPIKWSPGEENSWMGAKESKRSSILKDKYIEMQPVEQKEKARRLSQYILTRQKQYNLGCQKVKLKHLQTLVTALNARYNTRETSRRVHLALRSIDMALALLTLYETQTRELLESLIFIEDQWLDPTTKLRVKKESRSRAPFNQPPTPTYPTSKAEETVSSFRNIDHLFEPIWDFTAASDLFPMEEELNNES
jgi:hypothetical protein